MYARLLQSLTLLVFLGSDALTPTGKTWQVSLPMSGAGKHIYWSRGAFYSRSVFCTEWKKIKECLRRTNSDYFLTPLNYALNLASATM
jgi:hypothetical protein